MEIQKLKITEIDRRIISVFMGEEYPSEIDFNWLMPVVEKIEMIELNDVIFTVWITNHSVDILYNKNGMSVRKQIMNCFYSFENPKEKINYLWQSVVQFIQFYNKNNQS